MPCVRAVASDTGQLDKHTQKNMVQPKVFVSLALLREENISCV